MANKAENLLYRAGVRALVDEAKENATCADCKGHFPPYVLEFDHLDGDTKFGTVSMLAGRYGRKVVLAEIAKCEIVCANCHRIRTYMRRKGGV
jgi:L-lysine 2,3-aminomutase